MTTASPRSPHPTPLPLALPLFGVLVAAGLVHRVRLGLVLQGDPAVGSQPWALALGRAWGDVALALGLAGLTALLGWTTGRLPLRPLWRWLGLVLALILLTLLALLGQTHLRVLPALHTGASFGVLYEALASGELGGVLTQASVVDAVHAAWPGVVLLALVALGRKTMRTLTILPPVVAGLIVVASLGLGVAGTAQLPDETNLPPAWFTALDTWKHRGEWEAEDDGPSGLLNQAQAMPRNPGPGVQMAGLVPVPLGSPSTSTSAEAGPPGLRLLDPRLYDPTPVAKALPKRAGEPWNVVWIILESTGSRYAFGQTKDGQPVMPFLRSLAERGWWLQKHRSPSNSSATSIFAQMSGLYPVPTTRMFSVQKDNHVPSLFGFLGPRDDRPGYDKFLVTPGKLSYFFPRWFLKNSGLQEMHGFDELPIKRVVGTEEQSRDERETVDFFLRRLHAAKPPFAAVYYSFVAHWEYNDYGPQYRKFPGGRLIDRYHNNLVLLDEQIRRIVEQLEKDGQLDRTILVIAGDHGEAFGQHEKNWAHSRASFEENFQTPAVLFQPALFQPRVVTWDTSHVDLLPTVLDALGLKYDDHLLQGESLFQARLRRKLLFLWGNEGTVTAVRPDGLKVSWSAAEKRCWAYDLGKDANERRRLGCEKLGDLATILRQYKELQRELVHGYSAASRAGQPFAGRRHPALLAAAGASGPKAATRP